MKADIQAEFKRGYFDLGIYRLVVRHWDVIKPLSYSVFGSIAALIILSVTGIIPKEVANFFITVGGIYLVGVVWLAAVDHIIIGFSFRRILRRLKKMGIIITKDVLLHYCREILPK